MKYREFTACIIGLQAVLLISIYFDIPLVRQVLGFFYLAFIPGLVVLLILKLDRCDTIDLILYTIGMGLAFLMFFGLIINYILPVIGIERPLATYPVFFSVSVLILALLFAGRRKNLTLPLNVKIDLKVKRHMPIILFLLSLPVLSVAGTVLMNNTGNNVLLLMLIVLIIIFSISTVFLRGVIPACTYPIALFAIGISLLLMHSLNTPHLVGVDIHGEYHVFRLTDSNALWSPYLPEGLYRSPGNIYAYMTCISITILPTIFHVITGISPEYILKLVLVVFFSIIPIIVFRIARYNFDRYTSFLAAMFFTILSYFYIQIPMVLRQGTAFIFFSLLILALFDNKIDPLKRKMLFVIFVFSTILAHYSTAIIMFLVLTAFFILNAADRKSGSDKIKSNTIILIGISLFAWQIYTEGVLLNLIKLMKNFLLHLSEFLEPETTGSTVLALVGMKTSDRPVVTVGFYLGTLTRIFIVVGTIFILLRWKELKIKKDLALLQVIGLALLFIIVVTPYISKGYNAERVYLQTLIILAPSFVVGGLKMMDLLRVRGETIKYGLVLLVLVSHFAFQSGLVYQFTGVQQHVALSREGDMYNRLYIHEQDIESARWLGNVAWKKPVFTDFNGQNVLASYGMFPNAKIWVVKEDMELFGNPYIYLRYSNIVNGRITLRGGENSNVNDTNIPYMLELDITDRVFDNGASRVHHLRTQPLIETIGL